jgi:hypothetical protein
MCASCLINLCTFYFDASYLLSPLSDFISENSMHGYMKLMMGPFSILRGYPSVNFGSTPPPPRSWTDCPTRTKGDLILRQTQAKYCP